MSLPLDPVFRPRSVAVVGASGDPRKRGYQVVRALSEAGFAGAVYPVNPRGGELLGHRVYPTLGEVPVVPDLALLCTPASSAPGLLEECGAMGIPAAVILAVGFGESGEDGAALEARVREVARRVGTRVVGPNTSGVLSLHHGLNLIGARDVRPGNLALLVQSGNMALALMSEVGRRSSQGISICVGVGNETDVGFHEYLDYLGEDPETRAILVHAEGFGDARAMLETASRITHLTPVVLLKGARSEAGSAAARTHTGAVAGEYATLRAGLAQAGIVEVRRADELLHVGETLATQPPVPAGKGIALLSDGGGHATLAADSLVEAGVPLADLSVSTRERLRGLLGPAAAVANPVDLAGRADADVHAFVRALEILAADERVGGVLVIGLFGGYHLRFSEDMEDEESTAAEGLAGVMREAGLPLVVHSLFAPTRSRPLRVLTDAGVPVVESLDVACRSMEAAWRRGVLHDRTPWPPPPPPVLPEPPAVVREARSRGVSALTESDVKELLEGFGVRFTESVLCETASEVRRVVSESPGPVALKILSPGITHKSDAGGVVLGVDDPDEGVRVFQEMSARARSYLAAAGSAAPVLGVSVAPMAPPPLVELLVGARRDPQLGPVLTVGAGGVWVEILADVAHRVLPVEAEELVAMLDELRVRPVLAGSRGRPPVDLEAVTSVALGVSNCIQAVPEVAELEINPLFVYADGALAVDARAFLART